MLNNYNMLFSQTQVAMQGVGYQEKIDTGIKEFRIFFCYFFS